MKTQLAFLPALILTAILLGFYSGSQTAIDESTLLGYWYGSLSSNSSIGVVLYYYQEDGKVNGKIFFTNGADLTSEATIQGLILKGKNIDFDVPSQGTRYKGKVKASQIEGSFLTPGNPAMKLPFTKTDISRIAAAEAIQQASGSYDIHRMLTTEQMQTDFGILKEALSTHPQVNLFISKTELNACFHEAEKKLTHPMEAIDFIRLVAPVVAKLKCYHTQLVLPEKVLKAFMEQSRSIPLDVVFIGNSAYLRGNFTDNPVLDPGSEILEINRLPIKQIYEKLAAFVSSEGNNTSHIAEEINRNFWMLYHYLESPDRYNLKIRTASSKAITEVAIDARESKTVADAMRPSNTNAVIAGLPPVSLTFNNKVGILTIQSFNYPDQEMFKKKLADCFKAIEASKTGYLIVDLRGNTGGYPELAADLLSYFVSAPVPYLKEPDAERYAALLSPQQPKALRFSGKSYFLCNGNSLSSSGHFLALVKYHRLGTVVGEIPGGSFYCNDESKLFDLPNSGLQVSVAQTRLVAAVQGFLPGAEIIPDFVVKPALVDLLNQQDKAVAFIMSDINEYQPE